MPEQKKKRKRNRSGEKLCQCDSYPFPHREGGGSCDPEERMREASDCGSCGGSGGGEGYWRCPMCRGSGTSSTFRAARRNARLEALADSYDADDYDPHYYRY